MCTSFTTTAAPRSVSLGRAKRPAARLGTRATLAPGVARLHDERRHLCCRTVTTRTPRESRRACPPSRTPDLRPSSSPDLLPEAGFEGIMRTEATSRGSRCLRADPRSCGRHAKERGLGGPSGTRLQTPVHTVVHAYRCSCRRRRVACQLRRRRHLCCIVGAPTTQSPRDVRKALEACVAQCRARHRPDGRGRAVSQTLQRGGHRILQNA